MPEDEIYQADEAEVVTEATEQDGEERPIVRRPRTYTSTAEIDSTIIHPGSVRINVKGAFIVDTPEPRSPAAIAAAAAANGNGVPPPAQGSSYHETKDIRLPNHTAVVSHIAVDVGT